MICYTGYKLENLQKTGTNAQKQLLTVLDLLIDGLYQENLHDELLWRGSTNQRLLLLTSRYQEYLQQRLKQGDSSAGLQFFTHTEGTLFFTGVPPQANFRPRFQALMQEKEVTITTSKGQS